MLRRISSTYRVIFFSNVVAPSLTFPPFGPLEPCMWTTSLARLSVLTVDTVQTVHVYYLYHCLQAQHPITLSKFTHNTPHHLVPLLHTVPPPHQPALSPGCYCYADTGFLTPGNAHCVVGCMHELHQQVYQCELGPLHSKKLNAINDIIWFMFKFTHDLGLDRIRSGI